MSNRSVLAALAFWAVAIAGWVALAGCSKEPTPPPAVTPSPAAAVEAAPAAPAGLEVAILAGGCFWGMEEILRDIPGVVETEVGYAGGAEAVKVTFDPAKLRYATLLEDWYFKMHDPTTSNRQGNDVGPQYRSAIFFTTPEQRRAAEEIKARVDASGFWKAPLVTEIAAAGPFERAEEFHQDYLEKNPDGYTCHYLRD
ncbi:MAG TPA: peptide-methionine (S)-S-oxide reductase MsrA [Kofleriaceae bacterium]|nr:peptide-methionine (S)-S-oxide reductase MsrA [Kofleriaceae bacterium]